MRIEFIQVTRYNDDDNRLVNVLAPIESLSMAGREMASGRLNLLSQSMVWTTL